MKTLVSKTFKSYPQWPQDPTQTDLDLIACHYTNPSNPDSTADNLQGLIAAVGDSRFVCSIKDLMFYYASGNTSTYYYYFNHISSEKGWGSWTGAMHGDEIDYVFGGPLRKPGYSSDEKRLSLHMIQIWTAFASNGVPTTMDMNSWPRYTDGNMAYYELSLPSLGAPIMGRGPSVTSCTFLQQCLSSSVPNRALNNSVLSQLCQCQLSQTNVNLPGASAMLRTSVTSLLLVCGTVAFAFAELFFGLLTAESSFLVKRQISRDYTT